VVITGLGAVSPVGLGVKAFWQALRDGVSGIDRLGLFDPAPYPCQLAAEVKGFEPSALLPSPKAAARMGRFAQFAVAAAQMAHEDAGLASLREAPRYGVCFGSAASSVAELEESVGRFFGRGHRAIPPTIMLESASHAATGHVGSLLGLRGPTTTLGSGCATGLDVVQWAVQQVAAGHTPGVLAGGTDAPLSPYIHAAFCASRMATAWRGAPAEALRPFDVLHDGAVLGEGAAAFVLEDRERARARGARLYAEVLGFGSATGATPGPADPEGRSLQAAIRDALRTARLDPGDIDHIAAHGNGLPAHDRVETAAYRGAFGRHAYNVPVSSIKPMTGQAFASASALQVVAACFSLVEQFVPPTLNHDVPDPACDLDYVPNRGRVARVRHVLVVAQAVGGTRSALVLGHPEAA
jgi:3-oxoacyl-[acyl-carrier-protein] synthase II